MAEHKDTELMVPVGFEHLITLTAKAVVTEATPAILQIAEKQTAAAINSHELACANIQTRLAEAHRIERVALAKQHAEELVKVATDRNWDNKHNKPVLSKKQWAALLGILAILTPVMSSVAQAFIGFLNRLGTK